MPRSDNRIYTVLHPIHKRNQKYLTAYCEEKKEEAKEDGKKRKQSEGKKATKKACRQTDRLSVPWELNKGEEETDKEPDEKLAFSDEHSSHIKNDRIKMSLTVVKPSVY